MEKFDSHMQRIYDRTLDQSSPSKNPVILIKYGPPASGKGRKECLDRFYEHAEKFGFDKRNFVDINVDNIVSELDIKNEVKSDSLKYFKFRPKANLIADFLLKDAFDFKMNIVFETTGSRLDEEWFVNYLINPAIKNKFSIVVAYPLVPLRTLIDRSAKRALEIGRNPDPEQIKIDAKNAAKNINILYKYVDLIILFDNRFDVPCEFEILECKKKICKLDSKWNTKNETLKDSLKGTFGLDISLEGGAAHNLWNNKRSNKHKRCKMCHYCRRCVNCGRKIDKHKKKYVCESVTID